jgi:hypothetical protein
MCSGYSQCLTHNLPLAWPQKELEAAGKKLKELQDDLAAVQFTPHSKNGKLLMAKCRTLQDENSEIGREASEGKVSGWVHVFVDSVNFWCWPSLFSMHTNPQTWLVQVVGCLQLHDLGTRLAMQKSLNLELRRCYEGINSSFTLICMSFVCILAICRNSLGVWFQFCAAFSDWSVCCCLGSGHLGTTHEIDFQFCRTV